RWVIHTVGPVHSESEDRSELLASCYHESLRVAGELGAQTVAFPAVSAGIYGWPLVDAARIALTTVENTPTSVRETRFVLFSDTVLNAFHTVHQSATHRAGSLVHPLRGETDAAVGWRGVQVGGKPGGSQGVEESGEQA
ncbi:MAG: macro domain-containing protein, partial [Pseudonocardiaceae bacterium]